MSKSLKSMSKADRTIAINRRLKEQKGGLGYLAELDAVKKIREGAE